VYISDRVQRSGAGIVVKYDVTEVFTALLDLAQDKEKRSAMAEAAGRLGREFSPEALRGQYLSFFTGLAEASRQDATAPPPRCAPL
jgi:glycosyltransferase involved in cell wall biosynthesis